MKMTVLFLSLLLIYLLLLYYLKKSSAYSPAKVRIFTFSGLLVLALFFFCIGAGSFTRDISQMILQSSPKAPKEIYSILFKSSPGDCTVIKQYKDQVIPKMDCCIWMELRTCPEELKKIAAVREYVYYSWSIADSVYLQNRFKEKPEWWIPHRFTDSVYMMYYRFENGNEQSLLYNKDSTVVFVCDSAP